MITDYPANQRTSSVTRVAPHAVWTGRSSQRLRLRLRTACVVEARSRRGAIADAVHAGRRDRRRGGTHCCLKLTKSATVPRRTADRWAFFRPVRCALPAALAGRPGSSSAGRNRCARRPSAVGDRAPTSPPSQAYLQVRFATRGRIFETQRPGRSYALGVGLGRLECGFLRLQEEWCALRATTQDGLHHDGGRRPGGGQSIARQEHSLH